MGLKLNNPLFELTNSFFCEYLPNMRKCSHNTITTYKKALNQFLDYLESTNEVKLYQVTLHMINRNSVTTFLDYVEKERHCSVSTRNHKLDCLRSFMKYAAAYNMEAATQWFDIQKIPHAKEYKEPVPYLSVAAIDTIIAQPDATSQRGLRDKFMLLFLYQTGARVQELVDVRICDISFGKSSTITIHGKGSKARMIPVRDKLQEHLKKYIEIFHPGVDKYSTNHLFYTWHNHCQTRMTEDNVRRIVRKYGDQARKKDSSIPENMHPHLFRHSIAMHLYQNGVPLTIVSKWLGHSRVETTLIYAYADTEQKREAIENAIPEDSILKQYANAERYSIEDDDTIRRLYGLA